MIKKLIIVPFVTLAIMLITYVFMNCRWSVSGEKLTMKYVDLFVTTLTGDDKNDDKSSSVLPIDVHYDKQLVTEFDKHDITMTRKVGLASVTDRDKLYQLLYALNRENNYKYIILDIAFLKENRQPKDSILYRLIADMPRIVIPYPMGSEIADPILDKKAGMAQYGTTIWENDFVKYPYHTNGRISMPLFMYYELGGKPIKGHIRLKNNYLFYTQGFNIVRKSVIQTMDYRITTIDDVYEGAKTNNVPIDMGIGVLGISPDSIDYGALIDDENWAKDKYILIGDFESDCHATYRGDIPGTVINFNAYLSLMDNNHIFNYYFIMVMLIITYIQCYMIITRQNIYQLSKKWLVRKKYTGSLKESIVLCITKHMKTWNYPVLFTAICIISYYLWNEVFDILVTITLFYILNKTVLYTRIIKAIVIKKRHAIQLSKTK